MNKIDKTNRNISFMLFFYCSQISLTFGHHQKSFLWKKVF